ncbi:hypothetical protein PtrSN002B_012207, partial [Pyrenophora tritici-repentis]
MTDVHDLYFEDFNPSRLTWNDAPGTWREEGVDTEDKFTEWVSQYGADAIFGEFMGNSEDFLFVLAHNE